jgi:hypothetical protein
MIVVYECREKTDGEYSEWLKVTIHREGDSFAKAAEMYVEDVLDVEERCEVEVQVRLQGSEEIRAYLVDVDEEVSYSYCANLVNGGGS